jgi:hypothetical protein
MTAIPVEALTAILADWRIAYNKARPDAQEILDALQVRGFELVDIGHSKCVEAVRHVSQYHHGPEYPACAKRWAEQ